MADRFASIDYDALIDWDSRLKRESPLLERAFSTIPSRRLLDLGCGPGRHARLLASRGFDVVGVDSSSAMVARARAAGEGDNVRFVEADLVDIGKAVEGPFGGAICLGNTLPSIRRRAGLAQMLDGLRRLLASGGVLVAQLLNYEKILAAGQRHLPLALRPTADGTLVFVRLMDPRPGGDLIFSPTVLRHRPDVDPPVTLEASERVEVHGWTRPEVDDLLGAAGFTKREYYGSVAFEPYAADQSGDLVIVAR